MKTKPDCARDDGDGLSAHVNPHASGGDGYDSHTSWREGGIAVFESKVQYTYEEPVIWTVQALPGISIISRAALEDFMDVMRRAEVKE